MSKKNLSFLISKKNLSLFLKNNPQNTSRPKLIQQLGLRVKIIDLQKISTFNILSCTRVKITTIILIYLDDRMWKKNQLIYLDFILWAFKTLRNSRNF
jgi:hypothetical protein